MGFIDEMTAKAKAKAEEWDVQGKAEKLASEVEKVAHEAKDKAAQLADENRDKVAGALDKAGAKLDERTEGKYGDKIRKAKEQVNKGVVKLAEQRPAAATGVADPWEQAPETPGAAGSGSPWPRAASPWAATTDSPFPAAPPPTPDLGGTPQDAPAVDLGAGSPQLPSPQPPRSTTPPDVA